MIGLPIDELLSEEEGYQCLKQPLHPEGLSYPNGHKLPDDRLRMIAVGRRLSTTTVGSVGRCCESSPTRCGRKPEYACSTIVRLLRRVVKRGSTKMTGRRDGHGLPIGAEAAQPHSKARPGASGGRCMRKICSHISDQIGLSSSAWRSRQHSHSPRGT